MVQLRKSLATEVEVEFISEDELQTFEGWLKYQAPGPLTPESLAMWRKSFEEIHQSADIPKVGTMKLDGTGEHLYGVAVADGSELWLTLWVRRYSKGRRLRLSAVQQSKVVAPYKLSPGWHVPHEKLWPYFRERGATAAVAGPVQAVPGNWAPLRIVTVATGRKP